VAEFRMPALGADMDEGTLVEWLVKPGDQIHKGDIIAVVDTAKSAIEVESFHTGTIEALITPVGETVPVGTVLATITEAEAEPGGTGAAEPGGRAAGAAEAGPPGTAEPRVPVAAGAPTAMAVPTAGAAHPAAAAEAPKSKRTPGKRRPGRARPARKPAPPGPGAPARSTPLVRHEAAQLGVDLATVHGTGPGGTITRADVEHAAVSRRRITPLARRLAAELGVDLGTVTGTGSGGAVRETDVRQAASAGAGTAGQAVPAGKPSGQGKPSGPRPCGRRSPG
jgi:pyruvate dehydrogenase E2 component (dihydrolipoamide acetyltransferase)